MQHRVGRRTQQQLHASLSVGAQDHQVNVVFIDKTVNLPGRNPIQEVLALTGHPELLSQPCQFACQLLPKPTLHLVHANEYRAVRHDPEVHGIHRLLDVSQVQFGALGSHLQGLADNQARFTAEVDRHHNFRVSSHGILPFDLGPVNRPCLYHNAVSDTHELTSIKRSLRPGRYDVGMSAMEQSNMKDKIVALESRRAELVDRLKAIQRDLGSGLDKDYEEQAIQLENLEVLQEIYRLAQEEIRDIDRQLAALKADHQD